MKIFINIIKNVINIMLCNQQKKNEIIFLIYLILNKLKITIRKETLNRSNN